MPGIFISYRRSDSEGYAGRLFEGLKTHFGPGLVFFDVAGIEPGQDFAQIINDRIATCDVVLVLIGPTWSGAADERKPTRINEPGDLVRIEVETALRRAPTTIPILLQGATMPGATELPASLAGLGRINALELGHTRWESDFAQLVRTLEAHVQPTSMAQRSRRRRRWLRRAGIAAAVVVLLTWLVMLTRIEVPDLRGLPLVAAQAILASEYLDSKVVESARSTARVPYVDGQSPAAGALVFIATRVALNVTKVTNPVVRTPRSTGLSDPVLQQRLVGTWRSIRSVWGALQRSDGTLYESGVFSFTGTIGREATTTSGSWDVQEGAFKFRVKTSNTKLIPVGFVYEVDILDVNDNEFIYLDHVNDSVQVDVRVR